MKQLRRKLWWYYITIPLKVKTTAYHFWPNLNRTIDSDTILTIETLKPEFHAHYFTYSYYLDRSIFEHSIGLEKNHKLFKIKTQANNNFNPIVVALDALINFNLYQKTGSKKAQLYFQKCSDFLMQYAIPTQNALWFPYYHDFSKYKMKAPWVSGLTQALILSVFLRVNHIEKKNIDLIFNSLWVPIEEGGVLTIHPNGYPWVAEYPNDIPFVLNGQLTVIISLLEYLTFFPMPSLKITLLKMINGFLQDYSSYLLGNEIKYGWSKNKLANIQYKGLHAFQLIHLYKLTHLSVFKTHAEDWIPKVNWKHFGKFHEIKNIDLIKQKLYKDILS